MVYCGSRYRDYLCQEQEDHEGGHHYTRPTVEYPAHYGFGEHEVINCINAWQLGFNLGNVVKYVARAGKTGPALEDLKKARFYLDWSISRLEEIPE